MKLSNFNKKVYGDKINSEVLSKQNNSRFDIINKLSLNVIDKINKTEIKILDVGCRDCSYFDNILKSHNDRKLNLIGLDNVDKFITLGKKKGYKIINCDLEKPLPFKKQEFDIINCQQVLEHLLDTQEFIRECHRKLKKDSYLIMGIPNFSSLASRIRFLFGVRPLQYSPVLQWSFGNHKSMFTLNDLKKILIDNNFKIESVHGVDLFLSLEHYNKGINLKWLARLFPSLAQKIIIVARK